jgi:hypothetical protein
MNENAEAQADSTTLWYQQAGANKKLKLAEPDLQITCKGGDGPDKTFDCYSIKIAICLMTTIFSN